MTYFIFVVRCNSSFLIKKINNRAMGLAQLSESSEKIKVAIVSENASLKMGGEAALPLHYFRLLRKYNIPAWLLVHRRNKKELQSLFPGEMETIHFIEDTFLHRSIRILKRIVPSAIYEFSFNYILLMVTQYQVKYFLKTLIQNHKINLVHQPNPVSPKEPSLLFNLGVPIIIGPMNGGMNYPPSFEFMQTKQAEYTINLGRFVADLLNFWFPGKRKANILIVANQRTQNCLPVKIQGMVMELVENGVELSLWEPNCESNCNRNYTKFIFIGRLVDWKGVRWLLLAFQQVREQAPAFLDIVGSGKERNCLEQQVRSLGLTDAVSFYGKLTQPECAKRLQESDVLVLPSLRECGGAVVLEAMATEIPVIATNWGGPADYIDESCGILINPTSPETFVNELAQAMITLAKSPDLRRAMGKAGRQRVIQHFDWDAKITQMISIYQTAIATSKSTNQGSV
ncbi:MAG: glycosyltransferase family 4 protein [Coleofasciculus sp. A1-SPW-01]|uniref:glycosyltransferase family 4 protein n=1 Tax=Coleofasciculus sp. A1-SPW-01 TaxID=3070819 RepID=UPI0032F51C38